MDAREWEQSQSRRSSIKRLWDEDAILVQNPHRIFGNNGWNEAGFGPGATLPPIDDISLRRPSLQQPNEPPLRTTKTYILDGRESVAKRPKYDGDAYRSSSRDDLSINPDQSQSRRMSRMSCHTLLLSKHPELSR
jgi:hypothetical protein